MEDYLKFRKMITPLIIQILFWIGVVVSVLVGLVMLFGGIASKYGGGGMVFSGLLWIVLGPILTRIYCEILIVIFSINDSLADIRSALQQKPD
ncbi:MAG TPA: DUF4282 domain-containing protein [Wenzhouxiangella sp.]|nr:DUF4282 domain-containing protein [Wenzhouxiangella sp.]